MPQPHGSFAIGIDVGGTSVRVGLVDDGGNLLALRQGSTNGQASAERFISWIATAVHEVGAEVDVASTDLPTGFAVPGTLDANRASVVRCIRVPFLQDCSILKELSRQFGRSPVWLTDAEAATWGEFSALPHPVKRFAHLRLGTGAALGLVVDGQLERLDTDRSRHLRALVIDESPDAAMCACGQRGCLEAVVSWPAMETRARQLGLPGGLDGLYESPPDATEINDQVASRFLQEATDALDRAIQNLNAAYQPDVICLGGGGAIALPTMMDRLISYASRERDPVADQPAPRLERSRLGDHAGVIGAARIAMNATKQQP